VVFLRVRVTREGQDVRGGEGEDDVGLDLARVEVDDDGAGFGSPRRRVVDGGAHDERVLRIPRLVPRGSPAVHGGVFVGTRGCTLRVDAAAEEVAPEHAAVSVVQGHEGTRGGEGDDLSAEAVGVARGEELGASAASEPRELLHLVLGRAFDPSLDREHLLAEALLERRPDPEIIGFRRGGSLGRGQTRE
jgi:hypothetical protein